MINIHEEIARGPYKVFLPKVIREECVDRYGGLYVDLVPGHMSLVLKKPLGPSRLRRLGTRTKSNVTQYPFNAQRK